jgi:DNA-binding SARP family transcriptional activator/tetratricopeptide (TPR) repeat protein
VVASVEIPVESLQLCMLGPLRIGRKGRALPLPASRKVRALLAYLALARRPVPREQLCDLLWDAPNDPRGELRWCLSKLRGLLDDEGLPRVLTDGDAVQLDLADCFVDALEVARAADLGFDSLAVERLRELAALFGGEFLDGLDMDLNPTFDGWLTAQRRRFRGCQVALLERIVASVPDEEAFAYLDPWRELAPFDPRVHHALLAALARQGRIPEGDEHVASTTRLFEAEGLESAPIREAWRAARAQGRIEVVASAPEISATATRRRASIAVMPFAAPSPELAPPGGVAHGLAHDVISRLAKLRSLFVIAQGTVFALHERGIGAEEAGRRLNVDYVVSGTVRSRGARFTATVELVETRSARIVWTEAYDHKLDDAFLFLDEIGNRIVASIAAEIETLESARAILKPPNSLDAWESYHRGLWHMYRYRKADNAEAQRFFLAALKLDPTFSRAYAGLAFTYYQDAFQGWGDRKQGMDRAYETASQGLMIDDRDPAVHWAMGRALYLRQRWDECEMELERSIDLSPNFALGHYNLSFVRSVVGDPNVAITDAELSQRLSPHDPMLFGMLATRAMSLVRLERFEDAAGWAVKAAARPNAFPHIHAIAAYSLALAGQMDQARLHATAARQTTPGYGISEFLLTFPFEPRGEELFRKGAKLVGME